MSMVWRRDSLPPSSAGATGFAVDDPLAAAGASAGGVGTLAGLRSCGLRAAALPGRRGGAPGLGRRTTARRSALRRRAALFFGDGVEGSVDMARCDLKEVDSGSEACEVGGTDAEQIGDSYLQAGGFDVDHPDAGEDIVVPYSLYCRTRDLMEEGRRARPGMAMYSDGWYDLADSVLDQAVVVAKLMERFQAAGLASP